MKNCASRIVRFCRKHCRALGKARPPHLGWPLLTSSRPAEPHACQGHAVATWQLPGTRWDSSGWSHRTLGTLLGSPPHPRPRAAALPGDKLPRATDTLAFL